MITLAIVVVVGLRNSVKAHRRWRNGAIMSIVMYACASMAALCSDGDKEVAISASVMHLGTVFFAVATVCSQGGARDATSLPLMVHIGSVVSCD